MQKLFDGYVDIEVQNKGSELAVLLEAVQYRLNAISQYELFLPADGVFLAGRIASATDERVELSYELPAFSRSVSVATKEADLFERVELARKFSMLKDEGSGIAQIFMHPENLFLVSNQLYVAHRGLTGSVEPKEFSFEGFLKQYKALVVSTLNPKYQYEKLVTGEAHVKDKMLASILSATLISDVEKVLDEQYNALYMTRKVTERSVKKSKYGTFKFLTVALAVLMLGIGVWLGLLLEQTVPRQNRIIEAQAAFMMNNFSNATSTLSSDHPGTLPASVQYMLASSYVQLGATARNTAPLTLAQRQNILNSLSPNSTENELFYWIFIGRGLLGYALDIAYNIGDTQMILHVYALLYDYVYADMDMPGIEKQNELTRLRREIERLVEILEGDPTEFVPVVPEDTDEDIDTNEVSEDVGTDEYEEEVEDGDE